jgi:iron complex outermembrane receptor protein
VTSVSRRTEKLVDAAAAIDVITGERAVRAGAFTLPDALRLAAGAQVSQISGREWAVSARGFASTASEKMEVTLDGRTLYSPLFSGVAWDVPMVVFDNLDRIEVIRGPGAALWGSNAMNGTISIVTKPAAETQGVYASGSVSEQGSLAALRYGGRAGEGGFYRIYAQSYSRDGLELGAHAEAPDALTMRLLGARWDGPLGAGALTLQAEFYDGRAGQIGLAKSDLRGGHASAHFELPLATGAKLKAQLLYDQTRRDIPDVYGERRHTLDGYLEGEFVGERYDATLGVRSRTSWDKFADRPVLRFEPPQNTLNFFSLYAQGRLSLPDPRWRVTGGATAEWNSYTGLEWQPTARLAFQPTHARWMAWLGASRAVRTPSRIDRDVIVPGPDGTTILHGARVRSETLESLEAGWRWHRAPNLAFSVNGFLNRYRHLRSFEPGTPPVLFVNDNLLAADVVGLEASANVRFNPQWRLVASGRLLSNDLHLEPTSRSPNPGTYQANDARRLATLQLSWDPRPDWQIDATLRHVSELPAPSVPAYVEADLRAAWQFGDGWEVSVIGRNLLHSRHQEWASTSAPVEYVPRSVWFALSWRR